MKKKVFSPNNSVLINLLKVTISVGLLVYVFKDINLQTLFEQISKTSLNSLFYYFLLSLFLLFLASYRWSLLLINKPSFTNILHCYKANVIALFYNLFLPTAYGGDLVKWTQLDSFKLRRRNLIISVLADRLIGVMGLIFVGFFASIAAERYNLAEVPTTVSWLFFILFAGLIVTLVLIFSPLKLSELPIIGKVKIIVELDTYLEARKTRLFLLFLLAIVIQVVTFFSLYILASEANTTIPFIYFLLISPVVSLISVLPLSVAGFGTTEAAYIYFFSSLGATTESILVFTSLIGIFKIILGILGWITELVVTSKSFARTSIKH